ncbi:MAG: Flp pilus assembly complex ATPase component TadA [Phycisphaeraceae bacterium]|nr:Flp pilus assembly complex ATPase component TadA [Phycisphaeraceae bacterium]
MIHIIATSQSAYLLNPVYPVLMAIVLVAWAWVIGSLDKDAAHFYLKRFEWNMVQMGCGIIGFGLMLLIPIFPLGLLVGIFILAGGVMGYAYYRNTQVPADDRWSFNLDSFRRRMAAAEFEKAQARASVVLIDTDEARVTIPSGDTPQAAAHATLERLITFALPRGADRIDVSMDAQQAKLNVRIDGVKYAQTAPEPAVALALIDYVKSAAGMDLADRRKRQAAEIHFEAGELGRHTLEVTTSGSTRSVMMYMEIDTNLRARLPLTKLGLLQAQKDQLQQMLQMPGRVVLISAPPRHGTTTTLFSLVREHDPYTSSVMTLERERAFELEGISHYYLPEGTDAAAFNDKLNQMIRTDPQVMLLAGFADSNTARICAKSAEGIRFYVPMAASDTFSALDSYIKAVGEPKTAAVSLGAIVSQRLLRKLCNTCKTPYKPDAAALRKLNIPADKAQQFFSASGKVVVKDKPQTCPDCQGIGYKGRVGVFELMVLEDDARRRIAAGDFDGLRALLRKGRMLYLQESALSKVVDGTTDIKEVTRALGEKTK